MCDKIKKIKMVPAFNFSIALFEYAVKAIQEIYDIVKATTEHNSGTKSKTINNFII